MELDQLVMARPRDILPLSQQQTLLVFTDGAVKDDFESITNDALLVDQCTSRHIPQLLVHEWRAKARQVISQGEIFPILFWCRRRGGLE